jgi:hypothetical protein
VSANAVYGSARTAARSSAIWAARTGPAAKVESENVGGVRPLSFETSSRRLLPPRTAAVAYRVK